MRYQFTADLETGNTTIDSEHKQLIEAVDNVMQNISAGKGKEQLNSTVDFLNDYTKKHFSHEEELQAQSKFPTMATHKVWHTSFITKLKTVSEKLKKEGENSLIVIELTQVISSLINHIKTEDKKLADFLKTA